MIAHVTQMEYGVLFGGWFVGALAVAALAVVIRWACRKNGGA